MRSSGNLWYVGVDYLIAAAADVDAGKAGEAADVVRGGEAPLPVNLKCVSCDPDHVECRLYHCDF